MLQTAVLEVRVFPWRPRTRVMKASTFRRSVADLDPVSGADDLHGLVIGLALWITLLAAAPLIVLVFAALLFSAELPLVAVLATVLVLARFAGLIPWTVLVVDRISGDEGRESYRNIIRAIRRIRDVNHDRRIQVRWAWA